MTIRPMKRELPYAAFTRHLERDDDRPAPLPVDPVKRTTEELVSRLAEIERTLAEAQIDMLTLYPEAVRLKLSKLFLGAGERVHDVRKVLLVYDRFGTLTPPRATSPKKLRRKPA